MLTIEEKTSLAKRWRRNIEGLVYIECLSHNVKAPVLELAPDGESYQHPAYTDACGRFHPCTIHIGYGNLEALTAEDLFDQMYYLLGHEMQHLFSTTDKDWDAGHKLCFRNACQRLSVKVFGRTRRLLKDSDYEEFFKELADKGVFVNQKMIAEYSNFILNTLEDGRIESIRTRKHPGFGKYRKIFRAKMWLADDIRDADFFQDNPEDLDDLGKLLTILGQIYPLATMGVYQKGFLTAYGGTKQHDYAASFIPEISRAVLASTCKECMEAGRGIFDRLLDMIIQVCTIEADAEQLQKFLEQLLSKMLEDIEKNKMSASPKTEEKGDGMPSESVFGKTELEIEVDEETFEKIKEEEADAEGDLSVKVRVKGEEPDEESGDKDESSGSDSGSENAEGSDTSEESTDANGSDPGSSDYKEARDASGEASPAPSEDGDEKGESSEGKDSQQGSSSSSVHQEENTSTGHNNVADSVSESTTSDEELERMLEEAMEKAARSTRSDFELAEADAKMNEKFSEAAKAFRPVEPESVSLSDVDSLYENSVSFIETTRKYSPTGRLPLELENAGSSLDRKIDQLIKNKQEPDLRFLRSGMLDTRRIANLAMGDIDVFKKKGEPVKSDVAAFLLMDNSGSMGNGPGSTRFACCNAFAVLEEGFSATCS